MQIDAELLDGDGGAMGWRRKAPMRSTLPQSPQQKEAETVEQPWVHPGRGEESVAEAHRHVQQWRVHYKSESIRTTSDVEPEGDLEPKETDG
jgi:hypothetical protein